MSETVSHSVGGDFPHEQERVRELMDLYRDVGPAGAFALLMLKQVLARADKAMASGDVVAILRSYQEMRDCK